MKNIMTREELNEKTTTGALSKNAGYSMSPQNTDVHCFGVFVEGYTKSNFEFGAGNSGDQFWVLARTKDEAKQILTDKFKNGYSYVKKLTRIKSVHDHGKVPSEFNNLLRKGSINPEYK